MDALERLDEYLVQAMDALVEADTTNEKEKFQIENKEQAVWALRKIATIEGGRVEAQEAAKSEVERIKAWLIDEEKRADQARAYLDFLLEDYHRRHLKENPKQKTIKLPHGQLQFRAQKPKITKDDETLELWATTNRPEMMVKQAPKLNWAELKKELQVVGSKMVDPESGEVVPGIEVVEREPKFTIKIEGVK